MRRLAFVFLSILLLVFGVVYLFKAKNDSKHKNALFGTAALLGYEESKLLSVGDNSDGLNYDRLEILYSTNITLDRFKDLVMGTGYSQRSYYDTRSNSDFPLPNSTQKVSHGLSIVGGVRPLFTSWVLVDPLTTHNVEVNYIQLNPGSWIYKNNKIDGNLVLISLDRR